MKRSCPLLHEQDLKVCPVKETRDKRSNTYVIAFMGNFQNGQTHRDGTRDDGRSGPEEPSNGGTAQRVQAFMLWKCFKAGKTQGLQKSQNGAAAAHSHSFMFSISWKAQVLVLHSAARGRWFIITDYVFPEQVSYRLCIPSSPLRIHLQRKRRRAGEGRRTEKEGSVQWNCF